MNKPKYVFAQLVAFLDDNKFRHIVDKYDGNRYVKHFTCWNQLLTLMFGQLSNRESLRDLIIAIEATLSFNKTIFKNDKDRSGSSEPNLFNF